MQEKKLNWEATREGLPHGMHFKNKKTVLASLKLLKSKLRTRLHRIKQIELSVEQTQTGEFRWSA
jgi:hypothetical protein